LLSQPVAIAKSFSGWWLRKHVVGALVFSIDVFLHRIGGGQASERGFVFLSRNPALSLLSILFFFSGCGRLGTIIPKRKLAHARLHAEQNEWFSSRRNPAEI
jgi:hypothetical protein